MDPAHVLPPDFSAHHTEHFRENLSAFFINGTLNELFPLRLRFFTRLRISFMPTHWCLLHSLFADRARVLLSEPVADTLGMEKVQAGESCGARAKRRQTNWAVLI